MTEIPTNYEVHWNRDVPITVEVYTNKVVFHEKKNIKTIKHPEKIFLGNGVNLWDDSIFPEVTTLLTNTKDLEYVYTDQVLKKFTALSKIVKYVSDMGNNDVPYPYAIDTEGRYYLMIENVILLNYKQEYGNPYDYYYEEGQMSALIAGKPKKFKQNPFNNIFSLIIDEESYDCDQYSMNYKPVPIKSDNLYIKYHDNLSIPIKITSDEYKEINDTFGLLNGFRCMDILKL